MNQINKEFYGEILEVEEYVARRREIKREEIKKEQEKYPEPFSDYSSFLLITL